MPSTLLQSFAESINNGLRRKSLVTCSRWAEKCRVMGKPFSGQFSFKYHPWAKELHDCDAEKWVGQKAAQVGWTETALNRVFFTLDIKRLDCLYILPSLSPDATQFSAGRFDPAIQLSPYLSSLFSDVQNVGHKRAGNVNLYVRGSRSRSGLKSVPVSLIVLDEYDEMTQENLSLVGERQSGQLEHQQIIISTPTVPDFGINIEYKNSTQNHYFFKCPSCSKLTELIYPDCLVITAEEIYDPKIKNSYYICKECKSKLPNENKYQWLANGVWVPSHSDRIVPGYHLPQLYSSAEGGNPANIAEFALNAKNDLSIEQEFYNSKLGQVHEVKDARITESNIESCIKPFQLRPQITSGNIITMGVDQGQDLHCEINEWFPSSQNSLNFSSDINLRYRPRLVALEKLKHFEQLDDLMNRWKIKACIIDAHPEKRKALEFASRFDGLVSLCIYAEGVSGKNLIVWTNEPTISVDRTSWLDLSLGRFKNGSISLPTNITKEYRDHIKAQIRKPDRDRNGNPIARYITPERSPDHFAHARNYSEIALNFAIMQYHTQNIQSPR